MNKVLVVLSGGQDSTTTLYIARKRFAEVHALTFDYDQRHKIEIEAARTIVKMAGVATHEVLEIGPILEGPSPLTDKGGKLETYDSYEEMEKTIGSRVELTFVPLRNALFLTLAANRAAHLDINDIYTGVCEEDGSNYPDCRSSFVIAQESTINLALGRAPENRIKIHAPLIKLSKAQSIKEALRYEGCYTALAYSHTAYSGEFPPKTQDHSTVLRAHGFEEAGVPDPLIVRAFLEKKLTAHELPETENYQRYFDKVTAFLLQEWPVVDALRSLEYLLREGQDEPHAG